MHKLVLRGFGAVLAVWALSGCQAPVASFTASPTSGNAPLTVLFTDTSLPGAAAITAWQWDFGDGERSSEPNPSHTYTRAGQYRVSLTVTSFVGNNTRTEPVGFITVTGPPTAAFNASPREGRSPLTVRFTDESSPGSAPISNWLWDFGDNTTSTDQNPVHEYTSPGVYSVVLTVSSPQGQHTLQRPNLIRVDETPVADFSATPRTGVTPLQVQFLDKSSPGSRSITTWLWEFGDGATSTLQNPVHIYGQAGEFRVALTVTTPVGSDRKVSEVDFIKTESRPQAEFTATPRVGPAPLTVLFADTSNPGSRPITQYEWDFGDGTSTTEANPSHRYAAPGRYTVKLTVATSVGSNTIEKNSFINVQELPTAAFTASRRTGEAPLTVQFTDASRSGAAPITSWQWDFGDGSTSTEQNPFHSYTQFGQFTVTLGVTTSVGSNTFSATNFITVTRRPDANFTANVTRGIRPLTVQFFDASFAGSNEITSREWNFGDQGRSTQTNPTYTYTLPGAYTVSLRVTTSAGTDTESKPNFIIVDELPTAQFTATPTSGVAPLTVRFTDASLPGSAGTITQWLWDFGDGSSSTARNPSKRYDTAGVFDVSLQVTTSVGTDSETKTSFVSVTAPAAPAANFTQNTTTGAAPLAVQFTDTSTEGTSPITSWLWEFGDGRTSTEQNPLHTYRVSGTYTVRLTATNAVGSNTRTATNLIRVNPAKVLVFFGDCGGMNHAVPALSRVGSNEVTLALDVAQLEALLAPPAAWDLVIVEAGNAPMSSAALDALVTYYDDQGGKIIFASWDLRANHANSTFVQRAGVNVVGDYDTGILTISPWITTPLFNTPNGVPAITGAGAGCAPADGLIITPVSAIAQAGTTTVPTSGAAALTLARVNNVPRLILHAFIPQHYTLDSDGDSVRDMVELYENEIVLLLGIGPNGGNKAEFGGWLFDTGEGEAELADFGEEGEI